MVPKKIFIALQAHSISCHSAMGHLSTLWQLLRDGDRRLQYCLTAGGGRGWGQSPSSENLLPHIQKNTAEHLGY